MSTTLKEMISYKYSFSVEEKEINADAAARASMDRVEMEDEKKAVMSEYKAKIEAKSAEINLLARYRIDGYTTKSKYALKRKNLTGRVWEWVDEDTGEVLKTEKLSPKDLQTDIPFPEEPAPTGERISSSDIVSPEIEDLNNGYDATAVDKNGNTYGVLASGETRLLGPGEPNESDDSDESDETAFDADSYNPEPEPPKRGPGRPRK